MAKSKYLHPNLPLRVRGIKGVTSIILITPADSIPTLSGQSRDLAPLTLRGGL
jgi:hypothetical protein